MSKINRTVLHDTVPTIQSFKDGGTVRTLNDYFEYSGKVHKYIKSIPHVVPPNSSPSTDGGLVSSDNPDGAWVVVAGVPTSHRGSLEEDLKTLDKYPSGYGDSIEAVLSTGNSVVLEKEYTRDTQVQLQTGVSVRGEGNGGVRIDDPNENVSYQHGFSADTQHQADSISIKDVVVKGSTTYTGTYGAYGVYLEGSKNPTISGLDASGFSGGIALRGTDSATVRDLTAYSMVRDPKFVRGGYGVILDETRDTIIDGVLFKATADLDNHDGRHLLYVAHGGNYHEYNGCVNTVCTNTIANFKDKDDRNQWAYNFRKSKRNVLSNFIADGGNCGIANNNERGAVEGSIYSTGHIHQVLYKNGVGVYGTSFVSDTEYQSTGWIIDSVITEISLKDNTVTGRDAVGFGIAGTNGILSSCITKVPPLGMPIMVQPNSNNLVIDGVVDWINPDSDPVQELTPMITFSGADGTMKNITVKNVRTTRPMFGRITAAEDVTVDFARTAIVSVASGVTSTTDPDTLVQRVIVADAHIEILFHKHVTQTAIQSALYRMDIQGATEGYCMVRAFGDKSVSVRFYTPQGVLLNPKTSGLLKCGITLLV